MWDDELVAFADALVDRVPADLLTEALAPLLAGDFSLAVERLSDRLSQLHVLLTDTERIRLDGLCALGSVLRDLPES